MERKEDTPVRIIRRRYEEMHREERKKRTKYGGRALNVSSPIR